ncbi:MAG: hypothetical protein DRG09_05130 [Epsilonproteobacteria bacterium]|nr:MAG: hypothetical protein DRG09_05130 [Campylobacterota bacterium]
MTLPVITLPKVELPFDIPVLLHPSVDHFMIALPVVILLLELINLIMKKKAIGGISFFLIFLTIFVSAGAYLTGLVDGKEAYPALGEAAKTALSDHKLLGTYLLLASVVVFFFKFLSAVTGKGVIKFLYLAILILFVAGIFEQGEEGGELVYKYGMNVEQVKTLDDELFDIKEELEELKEELTPKVEKNEPVSTPAVIETPEVKTIPAVIETPEVPAVQQVPEETIPTPVETLRTKIEEEILPVMQETVETLQVEGMPEEMLQPQIATH